jgi:hypothetical protein
MPVQYGIVCGRCGKFHFVCGKGSASRISYDRERGEFKLTCMCSYTTYFRGDRLVPFIVAEEHIQRGYAEIDDCRPYSEK